MGKEKAKSRRPRRKIVTPAEYWGRGGTTEGRGRTVQFPRYEEIGPPAERTTNHQVGLTLRDEKGREVSFTRTIGSGLVQCRTGKITGCVQVEVSEGAVTDLIAGLTRLLASKAPRG